MRSRRIAAIWERTLGAIKYLVGGYFVVAGIATAIGPGDATVTALKPLYTSRISLVTIGTLIALSGLILVLGKVTRSRKWTGRGLFYCYLCYLFAAILNFIAYHYDWTFWLGNLLGAALMGALWLRWKFTTSYINPRHFKDDVISYNYERR